MRSKGRPGLLKSVLNRIPFLKGERRTLSDQGKAQSSKRFPFLLVVSAIPPVLLIILPLFLIVAYLLCLIFTPVLYLLLLRMFLRWGKGTRDTEAQRWLGDEESPGHLTYFSKN
jgi:hypothetical protein